MLDLSTLELPEKIADRVLKIVSDSRRQRLSFQILPATVLLQVPQKCSKQNILKLVSHVKCHLKHTKADAHDLEHYTGYRHAQLFPFRGVFYKFQQSHEKEVQLVGHTLYGSTQKVIQDWYVQKAQETLQQQSLHFAAKMGLDLPKLETKSYRGRWGACYFRAQRPYLIRYNWQLIQTPSEILDYVVVHELCHLLFFNHGPHFKRMLSGFFPAYVEAEKWLESHGMQLLLDNPFRNSLI